MASWKEFKYKNITLVLIGLLIAFFLADYLPFQSLLLKLKELKYLGAFLGGILFVSTFTFGIGTIILTALTDSFSIISIAFFAGLGAMFGDFLIFRFVKDRLVEEIRPLYQKFGNSQLRKIFYCHSFTGRIGRQSYGHNKHQSLEIYIDFFYIKYCRHLSNTFRLPSDQI